MVHLITGAVIVMQQKEKFGSAVVAVDATTGKTKWSYQIVHHDVWDYDLPSQPVLYNVTNDKENKFLPLFKQLKWDKFLY